MPILTGFLDKEIERADIYVNDVEENPEAPQPREMIDIEVGIELGNNTWVQADMEFLNLWVLISVQN